MTTPRSDTDCPHCAAPVNAESCITDPSATPRDGDISICLYCSGLAVFENGRKRQPTVKEQDYFLSLSDVQKALAAMAILRLQGKIPNPWNR